MNKLTNISFAGKINYIKAQDIKGKIPTRYDDIVKDIMHDEYNFYFKQKAVPQKTEEGTYTLGEKLSNNVKKLLAACNIS